MGNMRERDITDTASRDGRSDVGVCPDLIEAVSEAFVM
jgi:hypothetical protein